MNYANLAQKTNFIAGSEEFENVPFFLTNVNIPGITMTHPEAGGRHSSKIKLSADQFDWGSLSIEMLIDEDFEIYRELMGIINKNINLETGTFKDFVFQFWVELSNSKGNKVMKIEFTNCRISSVGDILLDSQDEVTEHSLSMEIVFDYYSIESTKTYLPQ